MEILELTNTIKIKIIHTELTANLSCQRIIELQSRLRVIVYHQKHKIKENEKNLRNVWHNIKHSILCESTVQRTRKRERSRKILEEIKAKSSHTWYKTVTSRSKKLNKPHKGKYRNITKEIIRGLITIKLLKANI